MPKIDDKEENAESAKKEEEDGPMLEDALAAISGMNREEVLCIICFLEDEAVELQAKARKILEEEENLVGENGDIVSLSFKKMRMDSL